MTTQPDDRSAMATALAWASRVMTVALEMVLPGVLGGWLDRRWGTGFLAAIGFAFGLVVGVAHLVLISRELPKRKRTRLGNDKNEHDSNERDSNEQN
ncbi:MAG: AtpZ/AtpI family protein [Planctomycetia bacterium]|nr:AtpZ/AtpI family protein [Planctomycetia bacterium]